MHHAVGAQYQSQTHQGGICGCVIRNPDATHQNEAVDDEAAPAMAALGMPASARMPARSANDAVDGVSNGA